MRDEQPLSLAWLWNDRTPRESGMAGFTASSVPGGLGRDSPVRRLLLVSGMCWNLALEELVWGRRPREQGGERGL